MYPVLPRVGDFAPYGCGVIIVLAVLAGAHAASRLFRNSGHAPGLAIGFAFAAALGGLARAAVRWWAEHWSKVDGDLPDQAIFGRGFARYSGLLGDLVANVIAPAVALGHRLGRVACQLAGDRTHMAAPAMFPRR